jgi:CRP-like cAMP-binding protein
VTQVHDHREFRPEAKGTAVRSDGASVGGASVACRTTLDLVWRRRGEVMAAISGTREEQRLDSGGTAARLSAPVAAVWEDSFMASFPAHVKRALLDGACEVTVRPGEIFYRGAGHGEATFLALIADGLVRTFTDTDGGRQITLRYASQGDVIGLPELFAAGLDGEYTQERWELASSHGVQAQALRASCVLELPPARLIGLAETEVSVAAAVATVLAGWMVEVEQNLADGLFVSIRARVARHLLDLAVGRGAALVVVEGHQEIAYAIGSVRAVVSRTLVGMREEGIVDRLGGEIVLLDPAALHTIAAAG